MMSDTGVDGTIKRFIEARQLAAAYTSLAKNHLRRAKEEEDRLARIIARKPLPASERQRLTTLIETGEVTYIPEQEADVPF